MYNDWDIPLKVCILSTRSKLCQIIGVCCLVEAVAVFSLAAVLWSAVRGPAGTAGAANDNLA